MDAETIFDAANLILDFWRSHTSWRKTEFYDLQNLVMSLEVDYDMVQCEISNQCFITGTEYTEALYEFVQSIYAI